jgi:hypothetical protein
MKYALWRADLPAGAATFDTESDALGAVRAAIAARGAEFVADWSLIAVPDDDGDWETLAEGPELARRASVAPLRPAITFRRRAQRSVETAAEGRVLYLRLRTPRSRRPASGYLYIPAVTTGTLSVTSAPVPAPSALVGSAQ